MEIIKDFLILKFHLSLIKIQMIVTQVVNATLNECCINYINIISDRSDLISLLLQVDNLYFLYAIKCLFNKKPLTPPNPQPAPYHPQNVMVHVLKRL